MIDLLFRILIIYLAVTHLKSSIVKLKDPYMFKIVLEDYKYMNKSISSVSSVFITTLEIMIVILLIIGLKEYLIIGIYIGVILHLVFLFIMTINYGRDMPNGCGCFGLHSPTKINIRHIYVNLYLLLIFIVCLVYYKL